MIPTRPILCLVTDRRAGASVGSDGTAAVGRLIAAAIDAGVDLVQVRERDLEAAALASIVTTAVARSRGTATRILVNDRLDVALACSAHGVHLRGDSIPATAVRAVAPAGFLIGRSVHSVQEAMAVAPAVDYLIAGTVFQTASKPGAATLLGPAGLRAIVCAAAVPVLAIGGVTLDSVKDVARAGAAGLAAIGLFAASGDLAGTVAAIRAAFDTAGHGS